MGVEKKQRLPNKTKGRITERRPDKRTRIQMETAQLRKNKQESRKQKLEKEEAFNTYEEDNEGFFKLPTQVKLDAEAEDERILESLGALNLRPGKGKHSQEASYNQMVSELDKKIEEKTAQVKEIEMLKDPEKNEKIKIVYKDIAEFLSKYRSAKLPKALKILPMTANTFEAFI